MFLHIEKWNTTLIQNLTNDCVCTLYSTVHMGRILSELFGWWEAWMLECTSPCCRMLLRVGAESRGSACFFFLPIFASRTQLPHLTFSIWPLPRGEIARVSKRGHHTSWILLSFNLHGPFSPWWCTRIRNEDIAQLKGFLRLLLRCCSYFCVMPRFWCIMDMDIGFITFVWCFGISVAQKGNSSCACNRNLHLLYFIHKVCQSAIAGL